MKLSDLITDAATGQMSHSKIWNQVAALVATGIVIWQAYKGSLSDDVLLWYLAILGTGAVLSKATSFKYGKGETPLDQLPPGA